MSFEVIPAIDLRNGKCVQLVQGRPGTETVILDDPLQVAGQWVSEGASTLHLIDLDGALRDGSNAHIIKSVIEAHPDVRIEVGGGIRTYEKAAELLEIGATRVILGTLAVESPEVVSKLSKNYSPDRVMVALDSRSGIVAIDGWRRTSSMKASGLARQFESAGIGSILFTNIDVEGLMDGILVEPVREVVESVGIPVIASGGVTTMDDIRLIKEVGASGVVIGTAIYKKSIILSESIKKYNEP